jgi:hypothetical protein
LLAFQLFDLLPQCEDLLLQRKQSGIGRCT